ncbi:MAG: ABC transporter transmembrane domain-containing protein, partial [Firmicutes bacterium]|nr:ABC transporter transmembrane domain-containing protein [Bacillota bacterium]
GYVEEMIGGQKLVKVFQHEETSKQDFAGLNAELCRASTSAHTFANILMPVMMNLSYIHYALTAALGAVLAVCGWSFLYLRLLCLLMVSFWLLCFNIFI